MKKTQDYYIVPKDGISKWEMIWYILTNKYKRGSKNKLKYSFDLLIITKEK